VGNTRLRPGGLLSVLERKADTFTNLLFLHTDSGTDAVAYSNRQKMFMKVWSLKRALEQLPEQQGRARLIVLGDLNTMGKKKGPSGADEIALLQTQAARHNMRMLQKSHDVTWAGGSMTSNLDHVLASDDLKFKIQRASAEVLVDGWVQRTGTARTNFVKNISDHCLLYAEVM
jgi:endonuclease/exonuclease/phosphatase family metal-dependent hydrolase